MSWGYGRNWTVLDTNKLVKSFETEDMKVYKANITFFGYLEVTYINNIKNKTKTVVLKYENHKPMNYDVSELKTKNEVIDYITHCLLPVHYKFTYEGLKLIKEEDIKR
jgi:hypothetical protein